MKLFISIVLVLNMFLKKLKKFNKNKNIENKSVENKNIIANIFRVQANESVMCGYFCIGFIDCITFDYIDTVLIILSVTSGGVSICLFTSVVGAPVGIASASFTLIFSLTTGIAKKIAKHNKKKKKKHDRSFMLAKSKLNSIETLWK